jgi:ribosome-associated translation inhibitor RaiA
MKISYSHVQSDFRKEIEAESKHHVEKLNRLLKKYSPDLIQLHGSLVRTPRTSDYEYSLNIILPSGTLHATGTAAELRSAVKMAFAEIELQVKKHQQKLRKDYMWKRKRGVLLRPHELAPAEE